jgi:2-isopropylmalate synthase
METTRDPNALLNFQNPGPQSPGFFVLHSLPFALNIPDIPSMKPSQVLVYDTTLRDGTQGEGISFSVTDKLQIAEKLDQFGVDYIEGGYPGSNPRDITFFQEVKKLHFKHAKLAAFGSTRRAGAKASEDPQLRTLLDSAVPVLTLVGKTWTLHVNEILRTTLEENLAMIEDSIAFLTASGREVIHDAEHFFDGYKSDPDYALRTLAAALKGGASNLTLCDTNGGTMVDEFKDIVARVVKEFGADKVGVHCHNDSGLGVAVTLAGVTAGASLVQGTVNGYGERTGNANLVTILPNLFLKMGRSAHCAANLGQLRELSLYFDELANLRPDTKAPYVGASSFAHKGGLHANAAQKVKSSYEHVEPALVGNRTRVLVSDLAGRSSVAMKAKELGFELDEKSPAMNGLLDELKELEFRGYEFEAADASLKLLLSKWLGQKKTFFELESYRVIVERRGPDSVLFAEATVKVKVNGESVHTVSECTGPVGALDKALRLALERVYPALKQMRLTDYKVRILDSRQSTNARTRVLIETTDGQNIWGTVGVSDNIIDASWEALRDAVEYKLMQG